MVQAARTKYGQYDEYHTSADDKRFMRIERVEEAGERLATVLRALDWMGGSIKSQMMMGEPQLGRRDLYPSLNSPLNRSHSSDGSVDSRTTLNRLLTVLNLADGRMGLIDMAEKIKCSALDLLPILDELHRKELVNWVKSPMEGYALEPKD
jgi:aminopeptidase-like protein